MTNAGGRSGPPDGTPAPRARGAPGRSKGSRRLPTSLRSGMIASRAWRAPWRRGRSVGIVACNRAPGVVRQHGGQMVGPTDLTPTGEA